MSVGGSKIHERLAHFFIDIYRNNLEGYVFIPNRIKNKPDTKMYQACLLLI